MLCEHYKDALIEAAASGVVLADAPTLDARMAALREHLGACASCRATFDEEQSLFVAIDSGLHSAANTEVPPSLLPEVREQLNLLNLPRHSLLPAWSAIAAAAVLVAITLFVRDLIPRGEPNFPQHPDAHNVLGAEFPPASVIRRSEKATGPVKSELVLPPQVASTELVERVSVLVPAGQKQAVDALVAGLQSGALKPEFFVVAKSEQPLQNSDLSPLDVSPLEVKPLPDVAGDAASETDNARP